MATIWPIVKPGFEETSWRVKYQTIANIGDVYYNVLIIIDCGLSWER